MKTLIKKTKKPSYRKNDRAMHLMYLCPENVRESLTTPMATFPKTFNGLFFRSRVQMCLQNLKIVDLPVREIIMGTQKNWTVTGYTQALLSLKFLMVFCSDGPHEYTLAKFEIRSFLCS